MNNNKGFTLVELLVVIGILAIIAAVAAPTYIEWSEKQQYRQACSGMIALMKEAKSNAISNNRQQRIVIDVVNNRYRHEQGDRAFNSTAAGWVASPRNPSWVDLPTGIMGLQSAFNQLVFNPNGTMLYFNNDVIAAVVSTQVFIRDIRPAVPANRYSIGLTQTGRITGPVKEN